MKESEELIMEEESENHYKLKKIMRIIISITLILIILIWLVPYYSIRLHPRPSNIPVISEVMPGNLRMPSRPSSNNINDYVMNNDSELKIMANKIVVNSCETPDKRCSAEALYLFVRDNIKYAYDPVNEYYELPQETLNAGAADCDGMSILLASLLQTSGIKTRFKFIPNHVYVEAWVPKRSVFNNKNEYEWLPLDPTCKECKPGELTPPYN